MAELLGAIQAALGWALDRIYTAIPIYGLAILLLTILVRALLVPLTVKQIKSMSAMQKAQPEIKKIQAKYKQLQTKAKDRMEVQQLRLEMNKEMQELFRLHGASPYTGCLPLLAQMPVLIAMFSVMRAAIVVIPTTIALVGLAPGAEIPKDLYKDKKIQSETICRPTSEIDPGGQSPKQVACDTPDQEARTFDLSKFVEPNRENAPREKAGWVTSCQPFRDKQSDLGLSCRSALGTGHLPREGKLFEDISNDKARVFGMHAGCNASQAGSKEKIRLCARAAGNEGGFGTAFPYYVLIALIVGTQFIQAKQMSARATGQAAQQQQMMTRIMPVFIGFISLSLPAGANLYFLASNVWQIGQQHILFKKQAQIAGAEEPKAEQQKKTIVDTTGGKASDKPHPSSKKKRKKKR